MKLSSHYKLGIFMQKQRMFQFTYLQEKAFLWGCVEPDINIATRFYGCQGMRGHNYPDLLPVLQTLFDRVMRSDSVSILYCYRLGKLTHYLADAFTYPHNLSFTGTFKEHIAYERTLEKELFIEINHNDVFMQLSKASDPYKLFMMHHAAYLEKTAEIKLDAAYAIRIVPMITKNIYSHIASHGADFSQEVVYEDIAND